MTEADEHSDTPPVVLVHGAFHGGWCWRSVARLLRAYGHEVFTPTQTGLGERRHLMSSSIDMDMFVLDILQVIECEELDDVVLVGHSYGGRSISGVADRIPEKIRRLIYLDGGLPLNGLSRLASMPYKRRRARVQASIAFDGGTSVPPPPASEFGVEDPAIAAWLDRHLTPQPLSAEQTVVPLSHPLGNGLPATYVRCSNPPFASTQPSAAYAKSRSDWRYLELPAGHNAMATHPALVAELIHKESLGG